jgi:aminocarboxymuconate-semialdehyde decarboxylase
VPQLGGTVPFLTQRAIDINFGGTEHDLLHYLRHRMWLDSNSLGPPALRCAIDTVGADRIVFGSDYPLRRTLDEAVRDIADSWLEDEQKSAILGGVATRWFGPEPLRSIPPAPSAS